MSRSRRPAVSLSNLSPNNGRNAFRYLRHAPQRRYPNRRHDTPCLCVGHWRNYYGQKNATSTIYVISINTANFDDTIYRNTQPSRLVSQSQFTRTLQKQIAGHAKLGYMRAHSNAIGDLAQGGLVSPHEGLAEWKGWLCGLGKRVQRRCWQSSGERRSERHVCLDLHLFVLLRRLQKLCLSLLLRYFKNRKTQDKGSRLRQKCAW